MYFPPCTEYVKYDYKARIKYFERASCVITHLGSLGYTRSSKPVWVSLQNHISNSKTKQKRGKQYSNISGTLITKGEHQSQISGNPFHT